MRTVLAHTTPFSRLPRIHEKYGLLAKHQEVKCNLDARWNLFSEATSRVESEDITYGVSNVVHAADNEIKKNTWQPNWKIGQVVT